MFKAQRLVPSSRFLPTSSFASKLTMTDRMTGPDVRRIGEKSANHNSASDKNVIPKTHWVIINVTFKKKNNMLLLVVVFKYFLL